MKRHLRRWGIAYLLVVVFVASWYGQAVTTGAESRRGEFWNATLENWQSEFLQLAVQFVAVVGLAHVWGRAGQEEQQERIEKKLDEVLARLDQDAS